MFLIQRYEFQRISNRIKTSAELYIFHRLSGIFQRHSKTTGILLLLLPTLLHTPLEHLVEVIQQQGVQHFVVLGKHVDDGVQCVVARGRHPFRFLPHRQTTALQLVSKQLNKTTHDGVN